jgi:two-component system, OmpR family, alkaline phosphatase synthesis response regulator PhoP
MNKTVLVVDDEPKILRLVESYLTASGYRVITEENGNDALSRVNSDTPDLIVLDVMLPDVDGFEVIRRLRKTSDAPVIMLTARVDESDRIVGLELGADDYVLKPFSPKELVARVRAVLRRTGERNKPANSVTEPIRLHDLVIDPDRRVVAQSGQRKQMTRYQFDLLLVLARNPGRVLSRSLLVDLAAEDSREGYDRTVDAHIKNIRKILADDPQSPRYIETVRGVGYRMKE